MESLASQQIWTVLSLNQGEYHQSQLITAVYDRQQTGQALQPITRTQLTPFSHWNHQDPQQVADDAQD